MKTYSRTIDEARILHDTHHRLADTKYPKHGSDWFAELKILELQYIGEHGLPDCYESVDEFLYDFWPGLPWNTKGLHEAINFILADERFPAAKAAVLNTIQFDMEVELRKGLEYNDE